MVVRHGPPPRICPLPRLRVRSHVYTHMRTLSGPTLLS